MVRRFLISVVVLFAASVAVAADLAVTISSPPSAVSGTDYVNTVTVTNKGPDNALNVSAVFLLSIGGVSTHTLPAPSAWNCVVSYPSSTCSIASFPPGTATFTWTASLADFAKSGTITHQVTVSTAGDPNPSDNVATSTTAIVAPPQTTGSLQLTASPDGATAGDSLTYTAQITNTGSVDATNVSLLWQLPALETAIATSCGSLASTGCSFPLIPAGATQTATRTVKINDAVGTTLTASAILGGSNLLARSTATVTTVVAGTPHIDLQVYIEAPPFIRADDQSSWRFTIYNAGPDTVTDWTFTFTLPPDTTFPQDGFAYYSGSGTCSRIPQDSQGGPVTCHGTSLLWDRAFKLSIPLHLAASATGSVHATASVTSPAPNQDANQNNNSASTDTPIITEAVVVPTITADKASAVGGELVTQTFTATNQGPDTANGVTLTIQLPAGSGFTSMSSTFTSCSGSGPIECVAPPLAAGSSRSASVSFLAPIQAGNAESKATVSWTNYTLSPGTASKVNDLQVFPAPPTTDLSVALGADPSSANVGDLVTFTVTVTDAGAISATNTTVQQTLPDGLVFVSASPSCSGTAIVTCTTPLLATGAWTSFTITTRAMAAGTLTMTSTAATASLEQNTANNSATATVMVNAPTTTPPPTPPPPPPPPSRRRAARH